MGDGDAADTRSTDFRAARSVHLGWQTGEVRAFYLEMIVERSTPGSYFMACGWDTGYFGIQELADSRKVALFSVWDPTSGDNPNAVQTEDRVELLHSDPTVRIRRFGGEGTGGQCMMEFDWALGQTNRFLVSSKIEGIKTAYAGHLWMPTANAWRHLVTFRTRTGGRPLRGLYSFIEDFRRDHKSVFEIRRARFGNGWVQRANGALDALTRARFTASGAEWESKDNIDASPSKEAGWFELATGGDVRSSRPLRAVMTNAPVNPKPPSDIPVAAPAKTGLAPHSPQHGAAATERQRRKDCRCCMATPLSRRAA